MLNAFIGIDNREMKSERGFSFAIASQPFCIATTVACMPIVLFRKIRTLLECAHAMSMPMKWASEQKVGLDWIEWCGVDTP